MTFIHKDKMKYFIQLSGTSQTTERPFAPHYSSNIFTRYGLFDAGVEETGMYLFIFHNYDDILINKGRGGYRIFFNTSQIPNFSRLKRKLYIGSKFFFRTSVQYNQSPMLTPFCPVIFNYFLKISF